MEQTFAEPTKHKFLSETPGPGCQFCGYSESKHKVKNFKHKSTESDYSKGKQETELINTPDPRGDGPVEDPGEMRNGQPNIIDYSNQEPLLFGLGQNSSHDYPGKIVINNESRYVDRAVKHDETKSTAETGKSQPLNGITQPTLPTGAPQPVVIPPEEADHNMHGLNFNNKIKWNENIVVNPPETTRKTNEQVIKENEYMAERGDLKQDIPLSQAFSDVGNNPHIEVMPTVDPNEEGLHNTGKDLSRTGPEGNVPYDNNNSVNYQGTGDVKLNIPTPYYGHDAKKIYDISGVVPEYQGLSEALNVYKHKQPDEFDWITADEIENMKAYSKERGKGRFILAVVSGESVTDHRPEGVESMRRRWTKKEMSQNIRTGKGKLIDINHMFPKIDPHSGGIYDANWNEKTEKGEMMIWETDEVILDAIRNNIIEAVSINTGKPRRIDTNCDDRECFIEPVGTILGEENGVALAYVVTANEGFDYHGQHIAALPPGIKFTKIYLVE